MVSQPYAYRRAELAEPDWRRFPAWSGVTTAEWESAQWQRAHCVKNMRQLRRADRARAERGVPGRPGPGPARAGHHVDAGAAADAEHDGAPAGPGSARFTEAYYADPVRRYMIPVFSDRRTDWPSHPYASRDSLHEAEMWAVEGLTHRYPTKVLAEVLPTCPQYCGHCTRMDLVGNPTPVITKHKFGLRPTDRLDAMIEYLRATPGVRDVVVSGGDVANLPWPRLEAFVSSLLDISNIRDIRLATKALMGLPQHWLADDVRAGMERLAGKARQRGVSIAIHTHVNSAQSVTPLVARATQAMLDTGIRDVRNQGVLLHGVNDTAEALLDLCFVLLDEARIMPYYFYLCDMIPGSEHWRLSLAQAQELQHQIMGYLPGFATPRMICDVPYVGKRWVHQVSRYDTELGISYWTKNYRTSVEAGDPLAVSREYAYYDPIHLLPEAGQRWWRARAAEPEPVMAAG